MIRLDVRPARARSEVSFSFFLEDGGFVTARHVTAQVAGASSVVEIEDARLETVEPLRRWGVKYDGPSHSLASAADTGRREAWQKSRLERLIVELDVTAAGDPVAGDGSFAQPVRIAGEVWVSGDRYAIDARGLRGKSWRSGALAQRAAYVALSFADDRIVFARTETRAGEGASDEVVEGWTSIDGDVRRVHALRVEHTDPVPGASPAVTLVVRDERGEHRIAAELAQVAPFPGQRPGGTAFELRRVARAHWDGHAGHGFLEELSVATPHDLRARSARPTEGSAGSGAPRGFAARGEGARAPSFKNSSGRRRPASRSTGRRRRRRPP